MYPPSGRSRKSGRFWWWEPNQDSVPAEFCKDTSLHALKYIYQPRRHLSERIFWTVTIVVSLIIAIHLINNSWESYRNDNIIVTFEPIPTPIREVPFPAITICNMNKVQKSKAKEIIDKWNEPDILGEDEILERQKNINLLHHVCNVSSGFSKSFNFSLGTGAVSDEDLRSASAWDYSNETRERDSPAVNSNHNIEKFLQYSSQKCAQMLPICIWRDKTRECKELFHPIETDFGKCCTFNMVPQSLLHNKRNDSRDSTEEIQQWLEWDVDSEGLLITNPYDNRGKPRKAPRRQKRAGKTSGLSILLDPDLSEYFCTTSDSVGFRLATHLAIDGPHVADFGIAIAPNTEVYVNVKPEITISEKSVKSYAVDKRQCYFRGEFPLEFYKYYTSSNCIDECIANETDKYCHCVRYYMPRDNNQTLCGTDKFACAEEVKKRYLYGNSKFNGTCSHCLPTCTDIKYTTETTTTPILNLESNWQYSNGSYARWRHNNVSIVHIYFGQSTTTARIRKQLSSSIDMMAITGGIMSLFLGFSGLSLIEFLYYFTLRAWWERKWHTKFSIKAFEPVANGLRKRNNNGAVIRSPNDNNNELNAIPEVSVHSDGAKGAMLQGQLQPPHQLSPFVEPFVNGSYHHTFGGRDTNGALMDEIAPYYNDLSRRTNLWNKSE